MSVELLTSTDFYILDTNFRKILNLTQYESLMWVDKYDQPGSFEIYAPPTEEIKASAQIGNYFQSTKSEHLMVIEKLKTTFSPQNGERLVISGRSLESILDRRVVFTQTYFHTKQTSSDTGPDNLEDAVRQLLDATFIKPSNTSRTVNNFVFEYTHDSSINTIDMEDMVFDKGENVLNIVNTIVKSKNLGYKITLNSSNQFVFKLIAGKDRSRDQNILPLVEFSPTFNNLKESTFTVDAGENFKNYIYTEGEVYNSQNPKIIETGESTGLNRREVYIESTSTHDNESTNLYYNNATQEWEFKKEAKTLNETEYENVLKEEGDESFNAFSTKTEMESEVEPRLQFVYGRDFFIGDVVQIKDKSGNSSKSRVVEFIISHSSAGYEEYPTFEDTEEVSEAPTQTVSSGGEYSSKGKMTNDEIIKEAVLAFSHIGQIIESTTLDTEAKVKAIYGANTSWIQHKGYFLRGATDPPMVLPNSAIKDGGSDTVTLTGAQSGLKGHGHGFTQPTVNGGATNTGYVSHDHAHSIGGITIGAQNSGKGNLAGQGDGNLVWYGSSNIPWASGNAGTANNRRTFDIGSNNTAVGTTGINQNHYHSQVAHTHSVSGGKVTDAGASNATSSHSVLPSYKNVYIWERTA